MKIGLRNNSRLTFVPISQNNKKSAWDASLSLNSSNGLKNEGEIKNNDIAFGGLSSFVQKHAQSLYSAGQDAFKKCTSDSVITIKNYRKFLDETDVFVGDNFIKGNVDNFQKLMGKKASRYMELNENTLKVYDKSLVQKLADGIVDVAHLPIDIAGAVVRTIGKLPVIRNTRVPETLNNISFIKKRADQKTGMDIYYRLKGIAKYGNNVPALRRKILSVPSSSAVGNYNTKDERALNRLATGAVSSMFVGNDFYNLVMYEKNDKKEASKAGNKRRNRELFRIAVNAFMTYSVLGALSSYVNKKIWSACAAIAGSALFAEIITRVATGIPLLPLSPEGAKKYNKKKALKEQKKAERSFFGSKKDNAAAKNNGALQTAPAAALAANNSVPVDTNMRADDTMCQVFDKFRDPKNTTLNLSLDNKWLGAFKGEENKTQKPSKKDDKTNPVTIKRVMIAIGVVLGMDMLYSLARTKSPAFNKLIKDGQKDLKKLYKKMAFEDLVVKEKDLRKFLEGFEGTSMDSVRQAYARIIDAEFTESEAKLLLKGAKNGVIEIDKFNPVYNSAYIRTAKAKFNKLNKNRSGKYSLKAVKKLRREPNALALNPGEVLKSDSKIAKKMSHNFVKAKFEIDLSATPKVRDGVKYYKMSNGEFNFGRIKESKWKVVIDAVTYPFKAIKSLFKIPLNPVKKMAFHEPPARPAASKECQNKGQKCTPVPEAEAKKAPKPQKKKTKKLSYEMSDLGELYRDCTPVFKRYQRGAISKEEFSKYISRVNTNPFNTDTVPKYPPASLASVSRNFVTLISSYFFINDFRNEVLIQSNGENTEKAAEVTKERAAHKLSNFVLNKFFMELFNNTFNKQLLGSLAGATAVAAATEVTNESSVRLSIGVPLKPMESREAIDEFEKNHVEQKGIKGAYYRLMARITGKKMLSEKAENNK